MRASTTEDYRLAKVLRMEAQAAQAEQQAAAARATAGREESKSGEEKEGKEAEPEARAPLPPLPRPHWRRRQYQAAHKLATRARASRERSSSSILVVNGNTVAVTYGTGARFGRAATDARAEIAEGNAVQAALLAAAQEEALTVPTPPPGHRAADGSWVLRERRDAPQRGPLPTADDGGAGDQGVRRLRRRSER